MSNTAKNSVSLYKLGVLVLVLCMAIVLSLATDGFSAQGGFSQDGRGGFSGPGPALVSVEQVKNMKDDARVTLRGNIVQQLGDEEYLFRDASGEIQLDIDDKRWQGQQVGPADLVEIQGKLDRDWNSLEIDVKRLTKIAE